MDSSIRLEFTRSLINGLKNYSKKGLKIFNPKEKMKLEDFISQIILIEEEIPNLYNDL